MGETVVKRYPRWAFWHGLLWGGLWLVPMLGCSLFSYTPSEIPPKLSVYYWMTGLFTKRSKTWSEIHVEVRSGSELGRKPSSPRAFGT